MKAGIDGTILDINSTWSRLLGWSESELANKSWFDFVHPDDRENTREAFERLAQTTIASTFRNRLRNRDGTYRWVSWTAIAGEGYLYAAGHDASIENENTDALRPTHENLDRIRKLDVIEQLAGGVAHEFNNSFQNIVASMELVRKLNAAGRGSEAERFIATAMGSAQRTAALSQRWFKFARSAPRKARHVAIDGLISGVGALLRSSLTSSIEIDLDLSPDLWEAYCDENQIESAVLNLAVVARDALPGGGDIVIRARNADVDASEARPHEISAGQYIRISVISRAGTNEVFLPRYLDIDGETIGT